MHNRFIDPLFHQRADDIICYKTLSCNTGLDWRNVCDGKQQCDNEWDEDEYRCTNGMCIAKEYWLDDQEFNMAPWCFHEVTTIDCNEHLCEDGQCIIWSDRLVFQNVLAPSLLCYNVRHANYMYELQLA
jgi:hypothetical protein